MGILYLSIEIAFDLLTLLIGCLLVFRAKDNHLKRYWGLIAAGIGLVFLWENIGWLTIVTETPTYRFTDLLSIEKMLKWYLPASLISLFPTASLRPGYLTPFKVLLSLLIPIVITTIGICYIFFNGQITTIASLTEILTQLDKTDIQIRSIIFVASIATPLFSAIYPLLRQNTWRESNREMYLFAGFMLLFLVIYILFTLSINEFIFNLFGATAVVFSLLFSIEYLRHENPFSLRRSEPLALEEDPIEETLHPLFPEIERAIRKDAFFTDKDCTLESVAQAIGERKEAVAEAIKSAGFTSFREYVSHLRLEHFKALAEANPEMNIKELMYACGFTSRSTFYRNFTRHYGESPLKYIGRKAEE